MLDQRGLERRDGGVPDVAPAAAVPDVALEVRHAALPRGTRERLPHRAGEPLVGVQRHEPHAGQAAPPEVEEEVLMFTKKWPE